ncbi:hypothetical protein LDENG_00284030 [Lucifuga dentata]|nr:hypothetical protein LDENG_00284030 [Lucifuga dentata]
MIQTSAARVITHAKSSDHIQLHWLPVHQRIHSKIHTFRAFHNLTPPYLSELLRPYTPFVLYDPPQLLYCLLQPLDSAPWVPELSAALHPDSGLTSTTHPSAGLHHSLQLTN